MKPTWTFFRYELRRYLPVVLAFWVLIPLLPLLDRGTVESWIADGDARTAAAVLMVQVAAPFLALGLALWSWLGEKTSGTARFVYARPVSGDHRFLVRFAGVWTAVAVYVAGVFLFLWVSPFRTFDAFVEIGSPYVLRSNPWVNLMWDLPAASTFVLLWILMAAGTLISIAATRPSRAMGFLTLGTLVFVGLLHGAWWVSRASGWLESWNRKWIGGAFLVFVFFCGLALLLAAWKGARRAPLGPLPWRRMAMIAAIPLAVAFLGVAPLNLSPLAVGTPTVMEEIAWGEGTLEIVRTPAAHEGIVFAIFRDAGETREIRRPIDVTRYETPNAGLGVFFDASDDGGWFAVDERGEIHEVEFPSGGERSRTLQTVSFPERVEGFAWMDPGTDTIWWMGRDRDLRRAGLPPEAKMGIWLDEDEILLFGGRKAWVFRTDAETAEPIDRDTALRRHRQAYRS